jgi:hypothetical protein
MNTPRTDKISVFEIVLRACSLLFGILGFVFLKHDNQLAIGYLLAALLALEWSRV